MSLVWDPSMKEQSWERPGPEWKAGARTLQQIPKMLPEPSWVYIPYWIGYKPVAVDNFIQGGRLKCFCLIVLFLPKVS